MVSNTAKPHCGQGSTDSSKTAFIDAQLWAVEGQPALVVAFTSVATPAPMLGSSRRKITVAVRELLNRVSWCLMKLGKMFNQLKAVTKFAVKRVGVVANYV